MTTDRWTLTLIWEVVPPRSPVKLCFLPSYPASKLCLPQQHLLKIILQLLLTVDSTIPMFDLNPPLISLCILSCTHMLLLYILSAHWGRLLVLIWSSGVPAWEMGLAGPTAILMMMFILELANKGSELFNY